MAVWRAVAWYSDAIVIDLGGFYRVVFAGIAAVDPLTGIVVGYESHNGAFAPDALEKQVADVFRQLERLMETVSGETGRPAGLGDLTEALVFLKEDYPLVFQRFNECYARGIREARDWPLPRAHDRRAGGPSRSGRTGGDPVRGHGGEMNREFCIDRPERYAVRGLDGVETPRLLLFDWALSENRRRLKAMSAGFRQLRLMAKTCKASAILEDYHRDGLEMVKASSVREAQVIAQGTGIADILVAAPLYGPAVERYRGMQTEFPEKRFRVIVPNRLCARGLSEGAEDEVEVFLDVDPGMGRTGVAFGRPAVELAGRSSPSPISGSSACTSTTATYTWRMPGLSGATPSA